MDYPVELTPDDNGTFVATFPDVPEAITFGDDEADAKARAVDGLETALNIYITNRREIPVPSAATGRAMVGTTLLGSMKVAVYQEMRRRGWRKADLARALALDPRQIDRLLDLTHATPLKALEMAFAACGAAVRLQIVELEAA